MMDIQMRPTELSTPDIGMDFGWQSNVYNEFTDNSHYALDGPGTGMHGMTSHLDAKPK
jgi:hypothetical protein